VTVKRMDNVGIVVEDLDAAVEFFTELGLGLEGRTLVEGEWAGRITGEVVQYEDIYRLCYIRGPERILMGLAQQLGQQTSRANPVDG